MTSYEQRLQRVANGSRRKRDLQAAGNGWEVKTPEPDAFAFAKEHFPEEHDFLVARCVRDLWRALGRKLAPTPQEVSREMESRGLTKGQLEEWLDATP